MNYNLKNKYLVVIALSFAATMAMTHAGYAEDNAAPTPATVLTDQAAAEQDSQEASQEDASFLDDISADSSDVESDIEADSDQQKSDVKINVSVADHIAPDDDLLDTDIDDEEVDVSDLVEDNTVSSTDNAQEAENDDLLASMDGFDDDEDLKADVEEAPVQKSAASQVKAAAPKQMEEAPSDALATPNSPFENFGNAILSKVDNDLFNQMSNIEKQTTILNLELKREELKNRVEALRNARQQARFEAEARRLAEEQKLKDMEAERKAKLIAAQEKLKEKEIELEKVRQNKLLNDYMNEMLIINQKWIEKNAQLQGRIHELEDERKELIATIENKLVDLQIKSRTLSDTAKDAMQNHQKLLSSLNAQIKQLKKDILDSEMRMRDLKSNAAAAASTSANPFAAAGVGNLAPTAHSVDISEEYAIMDITGKGDDIVAKIVNREGTTFTIHKGSVLKGGEVVLSITEKYIAFDSNGSKTYLYPGGSIMEYEPRATFTDSEKMQETIEKQPISTELRSQVINDDSAVTFGQPIRSVTSKQSRTSAPLRTQSMNNNTNDEQSEVSFGQPKISPASADANKKLHNSKANKKVIESRKAKASTSMSFSQGMFVQ